MNRRTLTMTALLLILLPVPMADALDAGELVNGKWSLDGKQTNHIGTSDEHEYDYHYVRTWALHEGVLFVNGTEYEETKVRGDVIEAVYRSDDQWKKIRIRFIDRDTVEYKETGENDAFGSYSVSAKGARKTG